VTGMSPRTVAIMQARMTSTRLPGKVLKGICGKLMLARQIERVARARLVDLVAVATSEDASDDPIAALCAESGIPSYRGSLADVLGRFQGASEWLGPADHIVRLTGDCPLTDPAIVDACVAVHIANSADYTANGVERTYPDGLDVEVMTASALARAAREAKDPFHREHVTPYIYRNPEIFSLDALLYPRDLSGLRWTVDTPADFAFVERIFTELLPRDPFFGWRDVLALVEAHPEIAAINS
jgi:spore coat polysaccharide biosynthesis protein SpsF